MENQSILERLGHRIPYPLPWDSVPLDLSFLYAQEKPAGGSPVSRSGLVENARAFVDGMLAGPREPMLSAEEYRELERIERRYADR